MSATRKERAVPAPLPLLRCRRLPRRGRVSPCPHDPRRIAVSRRLLAFMSSRRRPLAFFSAPSHPPWGVGLLAVRRAREGSVRARRRARLRSQPPTIRQRAKFGGPAGSSHTRDAVTL